MVAVVAQVAQAVQASAVQVAQAQAAHRQAQTQRQAVAVTGQQLLQVAQAVAELFMSGLRFSHGTFCTSKQR
jgi:hypothetical protein